MLVIKVHVVLEENRGSNMGDIGDSFREVREFHKEGNRIKLEKNTKYLLKVTGFVLTELTPYQYRIFGEGVGNFMDIYPTNQRYHNIITQERGHYKTIQAFLVLQLGRTSQFIKESGNVVATDLNGDYLGTLKGDENA